MVTHSSWESLEPFSDAPCARLVLHWRCTPLQVNTPTHRPSAFRIAGCLSLVGIDLLCSSSFITSLSWQFASVPIVSPLVLQQSCLPKRIRCMCFPFVPRRASWQHYLNSCSVFSGSTKVFRAYRRLPRRRRSSLGIGTLDRVVAGRTGC